MAYIEISNLPETLNLNDNSVFPAVYQGETKKVSFSSLKSLMKFFKSASYNKTTGVFTFGLSDDTQAKLNTDLHLSIKDIELEDYTLTLTKQDGTTETITLPQQDLSNYVEKVEGKGLSTEDYTTAEKNKLAGIDLTDYVKNTDYATTIVGGVVKVSASLGTSMRATGVIQSSVRTYAEYTSGENTTFISKGTLENVLTARIGDINNAIDLINGEVV